MLTESCSMPPGVCHVVWEEDVDLERESAFEAWEPCGDADVYDASNRVIERQRAKLDDAQRAYSEVLGRLMHATIIVDAAENLRTARASIRGVAVPEPLTEPLVILWEALGRHATAARGEAPKPVCANCHNEKPPTYKGNRIYYRHPETSTGFLCDQCNDADYRAKKARGDALREAGRVLDRVLHGEGTGPCPTGERGKEGEPGKAEPKCADCGKPADPVRGDPTTGGYRGRDPLCPACFRIARLKAEVKIGDVVEGEIKRADGSMLVCSALYAVVETCPAKGVKVTWGWMAWADISCHWSVKRTE